MPLFSSIAPPVDNMVSIAAPLEAHVEDGASYHAAVFSARHEARQPVVDEEPRSQRPPHIARIFRVLALFAVELSVYDRGPLLVIAAKGLWTKLVVSACPVDVGDSEEHVVQILACGILDTTAVTGGRHDDSAGHNVFDVELALLVVSVHSPHERNVAAPIHRLPEDGHVLAARFRRITRLMRDA